MFMDEEFVEEVVLVDEENNVLGTMPKADVHSEKTPLHRAFSLFIFNSKGELLLQQRSSKKKTWPLVWSNSCCGHPFLNESNIDAAIRRCSNEIGIEIASENIFEASPYRYCFTRFGVQENEICPILVAFYDGDFNLNHEEVEEIKWISWEDWLLEVKENSQNYSEWCVEETLILEKNEKFLMFYGKILARQ